MARKRKETESVGDIPEIISKIIKFVRRCEDAEGENRRNGIDDARFRQGEQWPVEIQNSRQLEARPLLTINKTNSFCQHLVNNYRQQRPRIKVHAVNDEADYKLAKIIQGMVRHIEVQSDADTAYDTAVDSAITIGWGYWRIVHDYSRPDSFEQEIYIRAIPDTFSVHFDPSSVLLDGSDSNEAAITEDMSRELFKTYYPNADDGASFITGSKQGDIDGWITKDTIRVCEYFYAEYEKAELCLLSNGKTVWKNEIKGYEAKLKKSGLEIVSERISFKKTIKWVKATRMETLEERDWAGRFIPIVPVYGNFSVLTGKRILSGAVRQAKDPARMYNFWNTSYTESVALAPKAKWLIAEGQDEGFENEWANANIAARPILHYKQTDTEGQQAPMPQRLQPEPPPSGVMQALMQANQDLQAIFGIADPAQRITGNVSGKALNSEKQQSDSGNFHFFDNATKSQAHTGRIILDLIPKIYDTQRIMRIIGDDGRPDQVTINDKNDIGEILNDVTVGEYDVVMDTGPGYNSKREAAVDAMMPLLSNNEELMKVAGDLFFRNMDFPGADTIADRLAASNPLAQIDDKDEIPPQVQMKLKQQDQQIQQLTQQLQAAGLEIKHRAGIKQMEEDAETKRELMRLHTKAHDVDETNKTRRFDTELKAISAMDVAGLHAHAGIVQHKLSSQQEANEDIDNYKKMADQLRAELGL